MSSELELREDLSFQRRSWRVQRVGWAVMALLLAAGLAGALGGGPLGHAVITGEGLEIRYERMLRATTSSELRIRFVPQADTSSVSLDAAWVMDAGLERIWPVPTAMESSDGQMVIVIPTPSRGAPRESSTLLLRIRPEHPGRLRAGLRVDGRPAVRLHQLVLP